MFCIADCMNHVHEGCGVACIVCPEIHRTSRRSATVVATSCSMGSLMVSLLRAFDGGWVYGFIGTSA